MSSFSFTCNSASDSSVAHRSRKYWAGALRCLGLARLATRSFIRSFRSEKEEDEYEERVGEMDVAFDAMVDVQGLKIFLCPGKW